MRIAINGFGRIGRAIFKIAFEKGIDIVAVNDLHGVKDAAYLLKHDSIYGNYNKRVSFEKDFLIVENKKIKVLSEPEPSKLPWKEMKIDVVIESTGVFRNREALEKHLQSGARKVIVTAPTDGVDLTIVPGINQNKLNKNYKILSVASCTTNCVATIAKILDEKFGIKKALFTTIHAYTADQSLVDSSHKDPRRGRAAGLNIVPTTTGASQAVIEALPKLKGKIDGVSIRVPVSDGSLTDLVAELRKPFTIKKINETFKKSSQKEMKNIIEYSDDDLVSEDIIGNPHSAIFDSKLTMSQDKWVKIFAWYDNEFGYSNRVVDVIKMLK